MRTSPVYTADPFMAADYNALRADAKPASWLLMHQQLGALALGTNPTTTHTLTLTINGTAVVITFVAAVGVLPGNVLIGATAAATIQNLFNLLAHPTQTTASYVALSAANAQLVTQVLWSLSGTTITPSSPNITGYTPLTSFTAATTVTGGSWTAQTMQLYVEAGTYFVAGVRCVFAGGSSPTVTAPVSNPRIDLLTINASGTLAWTTGTENASPSVPTYPGGVLVLAEVWNVVSETQLLDTENQTTGQGYVYNDVRPLLGGAFNPAALPYSLVPSVASTYNLGSMSFPWNNVYANAFFASGSQIGSNAQASLPVVNGQTVTAGQGVSMYQGAVANGILPIVGVASFFDTVGISFAKTTVLSSTAVVMIYQETTGPVWKCRAGTISQGNITWGTAVTLSATASVAPYIVALTSTTFVVAYGYTTSQLRFCAGTVSGNTITMGTDSTITATSTLPSQTGTLIAYNSTTFCLAFPASAQAGNVAGTVSGTTITLGSITSMGTSGSWTGNVAGALLPGGTSMVFASNQSYLASTISGTTVSNGSNTNTQTGESGTPIGVIGLNSTTVIVYTSGPGGNPNVFNCFASQISGTTVSSTGSASPTTIFTTLNTTNNNYAIIALSQSSFMVYGDVQAQAVACTVATNTITKGTAVSVHSTQNIKPWLALISAFGSSTTVTAEYMVNDGGGNVYCAKLGVVGTVITVGTETTSATPATISDYHSLGDGESSFMTSTSSTGEAFVCWLPIGFCGIAATTVTGSGSNSVGVIFAGLGAAFTGLTIDTTYYLAPNGTTTTTASGNTRLGNAFNSTSVVISTAW